MPCASARADEGGTQFVEHAVEAGQKRQVFDPLGATGTHRNKTALIPSALRHVEETGCPASLRLPAFKCPTGSIAKLSMPSTRLFRGTQRRMSGAVVSLCVWLESRSVPLSGEHRVRCRVSSSHSPIRRQQVWARDGALRLHRFGDLDGRIPFLRVLLLGIPRGGVRERRRVPTRQEQRSRIQSVHSAQTVRAASPHRDSHTRYACVPGGPGAQASARPAQCTNAPRSASSPSDASAEGRGRSAGCHPV
jgi:hypothetical protein